jgi:hypothetical protein
VATISIDVMPVNDPPTAEELTVSLPQGTEVSIALVGNDIDGDVLNVSLRQCSVKHHS